MVREDLFDFIKTIPSNVNVIAATKYVEADDIVCLLEHGIKNIGENRVDSFLKKYEQLQNYDITWHFIGHLQRNKALKVIDKIHYLHSLDSYGLALLISKNRKDPLNVFVEVSINLEENKNGVPYYNTIDFIKKVRRLPNINIVGLMMMSIKESSYLSLNEQFNKLKELRDSIESELNIKLPYLSMGMSDDFKVAIDNGATHIRLGRILFNREIFD